MAFFGARVTASPTLPGSSHLVCLRSTVSTHTEHVNLLCGANVLDGLMTQPANGASSHGQVFSRTESHVDSRLESTHDGVSGNSSVVNYATSDVLNINPVSHLQGIQIPGVATLSQTRGEYALHSRMCTAIQPPELLRTLRPPPSEIDSSEDEQILPDVEALCEDQVMSEVVEGSTSSSGVSRSLEDSSRNGSGSDGITDVLDGLDGFLGNSDEVRVPFDDDALSILRGLRDGGDDAGDADDMSGNEAAGEGCELVGEMGVTGNEGVDGTVGRGYKAWTVSDYGRLQRVLRVHGAFNKAELMKAFPGRSYEEVLEKIRYYFPSALCVVREWGEDEHRKLFEIIGSVVDWRYVARRMRGRGVLDVRGYYYGLLRR